MLLCLSLSPQWWPVSEKAHLQRQRGVPALHQWRQTASGVTAQADGRMRRQGRWSGWSEEEGWDKWDTWRGRRWFRVIDAHIGGEWRRNGVGGLKDCSESKIRIGYKFVVKNSRRVNACFRGAEAALLVGTYSRYPCWTKRWAIFSAFILQLGNSYLCTGRTLPFLLHA